MFHLVEDSTTADNREAPLVANTDLSHRLAPPPRPGINANNGTEAHSREALLINIQPEPVMMAAKNARHWYRQPRQIGMALLLIFLLLTQVAWLQFDSLSRKEPWRQLYQTVCPWIGCQVPVLADKGKIAVRNLVVRKHPDSENALMIDVILVNGAAFDQPFPDLDVVFSNINDEPMANRRFVPVDYLQGELSTLKNMPRNQPVRITLELVDPGEAAVNYKIEPR